MAGSFAKFDYSYLLFSDASVLQNWIMNFIYFFILFENCYGYDEI